MNQMLSYFHFLIINSFLVESLQIVKPRYEIQNSALFMILMVTKKNLQNNVITCHGCTEYACMLW